MQAFFTRAQHKNPESPHCFCKKTTTRVFGNRREPGTPGNEYTSLFKLPKTVSSLSRGHIPQTRKIPLIILIITLPVTSHKAPNRGTYIARDRCTINTKVATPAVFSPETPGNGWITLIMPHLNTGLERQHGKRYNPMDNPSPKKASVP